MTAVNLDSPGSSPSVSSSRSSRKRSRSLGSESDPKVKRRGTARSASSAPSASSATDGSDESIHPFTPEFFDDMAAIIGHIFPFRAFARVHRCSSGDVFDALSAVVMAPLRNLDSRDSGYYRSIIDEWRNDEEDLPILDPEKNGREAHPIIVEDTSSSSLGGGTCVSSEPIVISDGDSASSSEGVCISLGPSVVSLPSSGKSSSARGVAVKKITFAPRKPSRWSGSPPTGRVKVRVDIWGSYIPVDQWIEGHHRTRQAKSDAMTDEEFEEWLKKQKREKGNND